MKTKFDKVVNDTTACATLFDRDYYLSSNPDVLKSGIDPLQHYLFYGWREGRNPSAFFDTKFYIRTYLSSFREEICPLIHYANSGLKNGLLTNEQDYFVSLVTVVEGLFDREYYLSTYTDVKEASLDPVTHYLMDGWREGRRPSPAFDTNFYYRTYLVDYRKDICPLVHYALVRHFGKMATNEIDYLQKYISLSNGDFANLIGRATKEKILYESSVVNDFIVPMFSANAYRKRNHLGHDVSDAECFFRYLVSDFGRGVSPGPFFDGTFYAQRAVEERLSTPADPENSYLHWLKFGAPKHISPVPWFSEDDYVALNEDLIKYPESKFLHFIRHGMKERRRFTPVTEIAQAHPSETDLSPMDRYLDLIGGDPRAQDEIKKCRDFLRSETIEDIYSRVKAIEPEVQVVNYLDYKTMAPWHDSAYFTYAKIRNEIPGVFDNVVVMPFCKLGGADFVAGVLTHALETSGRTVVIRTEMSDWARPDWFPKDVASIDLSPWLAPLDPSLRQRILYEIIRSLKPKNVFNVNSRLAFEVFDVYGARLCLQTNIFSYYFCADRRPDGSEAGYPISFFASIIPHLTAAITDNTGLGHVLSQRYGLTDALRSKVVTVYTPSCAEAPDEPVAKAQIESRMQRERPVILWAGRFDRQKRFDLFVQIVAAVPDVSFACWGAAVLDRPPDLSALPPNLIVNPPFKTYQELPLEACDGFLYTSAWDGLPTILIELGAMGMPIVASAVGGVPELIDESTGWLVEESGGVADYVTAIREMLERRDERLTRATALQKRVAQRHSQDAYRDQLSLMMGQKK